MRDMKVLYDRRYHQEVVAVVGRRRAAYRTILIFLIESGALYCITWVRRKQTVLRQFLIHLSRS